MDIKAITAYTKAQEEKVRTILEMLKTATWELDHSGDGSSILAFFLNYNEQDMYNAASIFFSVASNYAIKHGLLNEYNAEEKINRFREVLMDTFGLDTVQEAHVQMFLNQAKGEISK